MLVVAAVIAGCGSDSSSTNASETDQTSAPLSKAEFIKQGNDICKHGKRAKEKAVAEALEKAAAEGQNERPSPQTLAKVVEESVIPPYAQIVDQLSQLSAPKKDEAEVEKFVSQFEASLEKAEADPAKAAETSPFASASDAAVAYGLNLCNL